MYSKDFPSRFYLRNSNQFLKNTFNCDLENLKGHVEFLQISSYSVSIPDNDSEKNILLSSFQVFFDKTGNITQILSLDQDDNILWKYLFMFDADQDKLVCHCYDEIDHLVETIENILDTQKKIIQKNCFDTDGKLLWAIKYHYDDLGELLKMEPVPGLFFNCDIKSYYNENLDEIERVETSPSGSQNIKTFEYQYDQYGNWITQWEKSAVLNITTGIKKRIIRYYDN